MTKTRARFGDHRHTHRRTKTKQKTEKRFVVRYAQREAFLPLMTGKCEGCREIY